MNKIKAGKAPGVCGIYPEYIQHGGSDAVRTRHKIVTQVWKEEVFSEEWHQSIDFGHPTSFAAFVDLRAAFDSY